MSLRRLCFASMALGTFTAASAQDFFDFGEIQGLSDRPSVQLDLDATMLGFVTATAQLTEPTAAELLSNIDGVRVRIYKTIESAVDVAQYLDDASDRLSRDNWQQLVRVQDGAEIRVFIRGDETAITGITAMALHDDEAVFVNVAGSIRPEQLAELASMAGATDLLPSLNLANPAIVNGNDGAN